LDFYSFYAFSILWNIGTFDWNNGAIDNLVVNNVITAYFTYLLWTKIQDSSNSNQSGGKRRFLKY
jgi:hypothetical protein